MNKEERFEVFYNDELGKWVIKDNEQMPHLLDNYKSCVRLNELDEKVKDLEAKLEESESIRKGANEEIKKLHKRINEIVERDKNIVENLNQQLAEKDEQLRAKIGNMKSNDFIKMCLQCGLMVDAKEKDNQDKISFAVEQLEKVKNKIESKVESIYKILDDLNIKIVGESTSRELNAYEEIAKDIDNQINELKGEMK